MQAISGLKDLKYVDQQLGRFLESKRLCEEEASRASGPVEGNGPRVVTGCNTKPWIDRNFPREVLPQTREALDGANQSYINESKDIPMAKRRKWSESNSVCSDVSSSTTNPEATLKIRRRDLFNKLFPSKDEIESSVSESDNLQANACKSLKRKGCIFDLNKAAKKTFSAKPDEKFEDFLGGSSINEDVETFTTASIEELPEDVDRSTPDEHPTIGLPQPPCKLREFPEGRSLAEALLSLKENILADITDRAIKEVCEDNKATHHPTTKPESKPIMSEEEPEDLDRDLEVTSKLMKELRKSLNDGSYQDMQLYDGDGEDECAITKHDTLWDVLLMLRRTFVDILGRFSRAYRPTGHPVADQEMSNILDDQLRAREALLCRYPKMNISDMLEELARIGHEADLKTLAGL